MEQFLPSWLTEDRQQELAGLPYEVRRLLAFKIAPEVKHKERELRYERDEARREREQDPLTNVGNRRALKRAKARAEESVVWAFVFFDGDKFGELNKIDGEELGDLAILKEAAVIRHVLARFGIANRVFRIGGDEFVALVPKFLAPIVGQEVMRLFGAYYFPGFIVSLSAGHGDTQEEANERMKVVKARRKAKLAKTKLCGFEGCWQKHYASGLCKGHYTQMRRGQELRPLQRRPFFRSVKEAT